MSDAVTFVGEAAVVTFSKDAGFTFQLFGGMAGEDGDDGADGTDGTQFRDGHGVPSDTLGVDGDYYLDVDTLRLYQRVGGSYAFKCVLGGDSGSGLPDPSALPDGTTMMVRSHVWVPDRIHQADIVLDFSIASFAKTAPNGGLLVYERGDLVTGLAAVAAYISGPPGSVLVENIPGGSVDGARDVTPGAWAITPPAYTAASMAGSFKRYGADLGADPTQTVRLTADGKILQWVVTWMNKSFWGVGAAGLNAAGIAALASSQLKSTRALTVSLSPANEKVYFTWPALLGDVVQILLDGLNATADFTKRQVTIVNAAGVSTTQNVLESNNLLTGTALPFAVT